MTDKKKKRNSSSISASAPNSRPSSLILQSSPGSGIHGNNVSQQSTPPPSPTIGANDDDLFMEEPRIAKLPKRIRFIFFFARTRLVQRMMMVNKISA
jgi:hypothetical protein